MAAGPPCAQAVRPSASVARAAVAALRVLKGLESRSWGVEAPDGAGSESVPSQAERPNSRRAWFLRVEPHRQDRAGLLELVLGAALQLDPDIRPPGNGHRDHALDGAVEEARVEGPAVVGEGGVGAGEVW